MDNMNAAAVGIDVSKLKLDVCIAVGAKCKYKVVKNTRSGHTELIAWLLQRHLSSDVPVVLEATGPYSEAAAWHRRRSSVRACANSST
ncbi:MAG: transposase [Gemmatimonadaceae bacterium]